jgi:hypothetical protein
MKVKKDNSAEIEKALAEYRKELEAKMPKEDGVVDVVGGFDSLLNKTVLIICAGYFYEGKLTGVNATFVELEDAFVVYNPDTLSAANIKKCTRDKLPAKKWNVQIGSVESYGELQ